MRDDVFAEFSHLIREKYIFTDRSDSQISLYKARLILVDNSVLEFSEITVFTIQKRKYSFQWMRSDFSLIIRWDNASHHRHISTFPHHKHVSEEDCIEPSEEKFLPDILYFIEQKINN